ncbi:MAG: hypothetical protein U0359_27865 [Byssovorax sp.]
MLDRLTFAFALLLGSTLTACGGKVIADGIGGEGGSTGTSSSTGTTTTMPPPPLLTPQKVDLLLVVDNSRSMDDKQQILASTLPDVLLGLLSPRCVDGSGNPAGVQPQNPVDACSPGTKREFVPVTDLHIGLISTSLGGHGSDACSTTEAQSCPSGNSTNNDAGHLLSRKAPCQGGSVQTYQGKGFLAWDPQQKLSPPGESVIGDLNGQTGLVPSLRDMVGGLGQIGCGYESQLESWYRFLIDPEPYQSISVQNGKAVPQGQDAQLLQQRFDFLRPDSMLIIVMLSDENDCSIKEYGQFYFAAQQRNPSDPKKAFRLPRPRAECAKNPKDPCCKSCGQDPGSCPPDPGCKESPTLPDIDDDINLRCFDQKRRFGIDFLYPIERYMDGLNNAQIANREGDLVDNPLFAEHGPNGPVRDPGLVFLLGIVGVPWQDIARDPKSPAAGFKTTAELDGPAFPGTNSSAWDYILGDPANYVPPMDPHMIEAIAPRSGQNPISGDTIAPPGSSPGADGINGHEYSIPLKDDLQYACVFNLPSPKDCSQGAVCDCSDPKNDNPLCDPAKKTIQLRAKAYPGIRELSLLHGLGNQGVVGSVCPVQTVDTAQSSYGYRPAVASLLSQIRARLPQP